MKKERISIDEIECLRRELNRLGKEMGANDSSVLALSQKLDDLIVRYTKEQMMLHHRKI